MTECKSDGSIAPRLMLVCNRPMCPSTLDRLRTSLDRALASGSRPMVVEHGVEVYQLIEGRWTPLDPRLPDRAAPDAEADEG